MTFDLKKFLMTDLGMDDAEATATAAKIKPENVTSLAGSYKSRADLDAATTDINRVRAELATANDRLNAEMAEWATLTTREKSEATDLRAAVEAARVRATQLESRLTTLATQHGVDPKPLLEGTTVIPEKKVEPVVPAVDPRIEKMGGAINFSLDLPADLNYISNEHFDLTGERLDTRDIVKAIKANAAKGGTVNPVEIWEAKYGIAEKRSVKAAETQSKLIADAEARGEERARSQQALPNATAPGRHAPVFGKQNAQGVVQPRTSLLQRPQPGVGLASAVSALRTHKYRQSA